MHISNRQVYFTYLVLTLVSIAITSVSAQKCVDSRLPFPFGNNVASCNDIGGKIKQKACKNAKFASHCPKACGACKEFKCADSKRHFIKKGITRTCDWLNGMSLKKKEKRCMNRKIKNTCRSTCDYCGPKGDFVDFDEVKVKEAVKYEWNEEKDLYFYNTLAFNSEYGKTQYPELPWDKVTTTKPNIGMTKGRFRVTYMACFEGSFDLKSMTLAPMHHNDTYYDEYYYSEDDDYYYDGNGIPELSAIFEARDKDGNLVGEFLVEFEEYGEVKHVKFPSDIFQDINYVEWWSYNRPIQYGFDTLDVEIKSPCNRDYLNGNMDKATEIQQDFKDSVPSTSLAKRSWLFHQ